MDFDIINQHLNVSTFLKNITTNKTFELDGKMLLHAVEHPTVVDHF